MRGKFTTHIPGTAEVWNQIEKMTRTSNAFVRNNANPTFRDISGVLKECEQTSQVIRSYLEYACLDENSEAEKHKPHYPPSPIKLSFENQTLRVFTPLTFNRGIPDSYILAESVRKELQKYQEDINQSLFRKLKPPLTVIILRKAMKYSSRFKDNDNMETGRIINVIFPELGLSDNCMLAPDLHSGFRLVHNPNEEGMEFIIFSQHDSNWHLDDLFAGSNEMIMQYR